MLFLAVGRFVRPVFFWWSAFMVAGLPAFSAAEQTAEPEQQVRNNFVMGALGDSITSGVNSTGWGSQIEHSWATGNHSDGQVVSHFMRLKNTFQDRVIERHNVARGGAKASGLASQVRDLAGLQPDYVSVLIGANDACGWSEDSSSQISGFKNSVATAMTGLIDLNPDVKILLLPIPNMYGLWEVGSGMSCQWLWDLTGICSPLLSSARTRAERQAFQARVDRANLKLQEVADEYSENIMFDLSLAQYQFSAEHISRLDCFHPSGQGQNLVAELSWETGWFAGQ